eukprot:CAMPEP_0114288046 /NCGR_PEP_ID=MMETSP0059-20121206/6603_1 /TAXON_ID=36894 /ORGANISM="Pyramimonas parkeae, Strain CCMP726" /LENGTH=87 /DNA_ID=CAMNT_0001409169 /DNA_START=110 /DNA_END=373 /DNA_ORIENTATION=+
MSSTTRRQPSQRQNSLQQHTCPANTRQSREVGTPNNIASKLVNDPHDITTEHHQSGDHVLIDDKFAGGMFRRGGLGGPGGRLNGFKG